eukprot:1182931-Prymnesium_polylepis.3
MLAWLDLLDTHQRASLRHISSGSVRSGARTSDRMRAIRRVVGSSPAAVTPIICARSIIG